VWYNHGPPFGKGVCQVLGFSAFLGLITPFAGVLGMSSRDFKSRVPPISGHIFHVSDQGFGWKSPSKEASFSWQDARAIRETREFFIIRLRPSGFFTIFKEDLSLADVAAVRDIMCNVAVEKKKLLPAQGRYTG
jgi:hypothetical protein